MKRIFLLSLILLCSCKADDDWSAFKTAHNCKIVSKMDSTESFTTGGHLVFNPAKDGWLCDDGITYFKNR